MSAESSAPSQRPRLAPAPTTLSGEPNEVQKLKRSCRIHSVELPCSTQLSWRPTGGLATTQPCSSAARSAVPPREGKPGTVSMRRNSLAHGSSTDGAGGARDAAATTTCTTTAPRRPRRISRRPSSRCGRRPPPPPPPRTPPRPRCRAWCARRRRRGPPAPAGACHAWCAGARSEPNAPSSI